MKTRVATAISEGSATDVARFICGELRRQLGTARPALCVVFASTSQPLEQLLPEVQREFPDSALIGCSTSGEFIQDGDRKHATCAFALTGDFQVFTGLGRGLKADPEHAVRAACEDVPAQLEGYPHRTALMLLDPLAGVSEEAVLISAGLFGEGINLAGGAAGDDLKMQRTVVGCGDKVESDAVVFAVLYSRTPIGIGVAHGHRALSRPLTVTKAEGNVVEEIDGRPAWDVWVEQTESAAKRANIDTKHLRDDAVGAFLLRYEAALDCGSELKMRAPLSRQRDGAIAFACGIPQGSEIRITESEAEDQVRSARTAAQRSRQQIAGRKVAGALVFDCICRNLILGDAFRRAVGEVVEVIGGAPVAGFETYGEIALNAGDFSGFHNTTTVVLSFAEE